MSTVKPLAATPRLVSYPDLGPELLSVETPPISCKFVNTVFYQS